MTRWLVNVEFGYTEDVAVLVAAATQDEATDLAFDWFLADPDSDRPEAATVVREATVTDEHFHVKVN